MSENGRARPRLFTIPPDVDFLSALARAMLAGDLPHPGRAPPRPQELADWTIWLPTRRTARLLAAALMRAAPSAAQILARIHPLGDVDEDELALTHAAAEDLLCDLRPPVPPLVRHFLLADLVREWARRDRAWPLAALIRAHPGEAMKMARALAKLLDSFEIEEVPLDKLAELLDEERPQHRLAARDLLRHVRTRYPERLADMGYMDAAERRSRLIHARAEAYRDDPPAAPVIAAGSTGTIPATATLLATIARMENGCVVLPGLDRDMDEASWQALEEGHPQYGMKRLLEIIGVDRGEVEDLPGMARSRREAGVARVRLLSEVMRPAETTDRWRRVVADRGALLRRGFEGLHVFEADDRHHAARGIALIMREVLERRIEDPLTGAVRPATAALITPDRDLAREVREELSRWHIAVDDSAGQPLIDTPPGVFLKMLLEAALEGFAPERLAPMAAHPLARFGFSRGEFLARFTALETTVLRHLPRNPGLSGLMEAIRRRRRQVENAPHHEHRAIRALDAADWADMEGTTRALLDALGDLERLADRPEPAAFAEAIRTIFAAAEAATRDAEGVAALWDENAGEALAEAAAELLEHARAIAPPPMPLRDVAAFLFAELAARPVRPPQTAEAPLMILGLLEARLVPADVKILAGLNEDVWPPVAEVDPFLNRPDRRRIALPVPERRIGLTAHDFVQAAANAKAWLVSCARLDQKPAVPSRWLLRLRALQAASGCADACAAPMPVAAWARALDEPGAAPRPVAPPTPRPDPCRRPSRLSVTRVGLLMKAPYAFYAERILGLEPLPDLLCRVGPRELGGVVHAAVERFARDHPGPDLPADAADRLKALLEDAFGAVVDDPARLNWWRVRLARMAAWLAEREGLWRDSVTRVHPEVRGCLTLETEEARFTLTGRADRIDQLVDGGVRILDFKTGQVPAKKPQSRRYDPQLDLEAAMALAGAFEGIAKTSVISELAYVKISGGDPPGGVEPLKALKGQADLADRARTVLKGCSRLLAAYGRADQPYLPVGLDGDTPWLKPFAHLARVGEWRSRADAEE